MYEKKDLCVVLQRMAQIIETNKDYLGELDGQSGDGDLGISMNAAFAACAHTAEACEETDLGKLLMKVGMACNKAAPSTMGTLLSGGILALAKACKGKTQLSDSELIAFPRIFADAIAQRGKSKQGDKTILDALYPLAEQAEMKFASGADLISAFTSAAQAAEQAAAQTAGMLAKSGRAKWLGERAAAYPDGGAVMCGLLMKGICLQ